MPSTQQHITQWKHNRLLLQSDACRAFPDWKVTIAFYCALHAVEALFDKTFSLHLKEHKDRNRFLADRQNKLLAIWTPYKVLFDASHDARYSCPDPAKRFAPPILQELIQRRLRSVESYALAEIAAPPEEFPHLKVDPADGRIIVETTPPPA